MNQRRVVTCSTPAKQSTIPVEDTVNQAGRQSLTACKVSDMTVGYLRMTARVCSFTPAAAAVALHPVSHTPVPWALMSLIPHVCAGEAGQRVGGGRGEDKEDQG